MFFFLSFFLFFFFFVTRTGSDRDKEGMLHESTKEKKEKNDAKKLGG